MDGGTIKRKGKGSCGARIVSPGATERVREAPLTMTESPMYHLAPASTPEGARPVRPPTFPRCSACDLPLYDTPTAKAEHEPMCPGPQRRRGRPRKYPVGYTPRYTYPRGGARKGWKWRLAKLDEAMGHSMALRYRGENLYPLAWVGARYKISAQGLYRRVRRAGIPYVLAPGRARGVACLPESSLTLLLELVLFKSRGAPYHTRRL